jgi:hypothetical protein
MAHVKAHVADVDQNLFRELRLTDGIGVTEHSSNRRDQSQLIENARSPYISRMKNQRDSLEGVVNPRPQESVRI